MIICTNRGSPAPGIASKGLHEAELQVCPLWPGGYQIQWHISICVHRVGHHVVTASRGALDDNCIDFESELKLAQVHHF